MGSSLLRERGFGRVPALCLHAENSRTDCQVHFITTRLSTHCTWLHTDHFPPILND